MPPVARAGRRRGGVPYWALSLVILPCLLTAPRLASATGPRDQALEAAVTTLESAFRSAEAARLRPILPRQGKVFLSLASLGPRSGYFSPDQLVEVLSGWLVSHPFQDVGVRDQDVKPGEDRAVLRVRGTLRGSSSRSIDIRVGLSREGSLWALREIREQPGP